MIRPVRALSELFWPPQWRVVPAGADAASACSVLHASAFSRGWTRQEFEALLAERAVVADLLLDRRRPRSEPAGFILSRFAADEAEIYSVAVSPRLRHKGGGTTLLRSHLDRLSRLGVRRVTLEVDLGNAPARRLYHRFGFSEVGRRTGYYRSGPGEATTALILARPLDVAPRLHPEALVT